MKNWLASCGLGLVCAALLVCSPARAIPLTWTLNNFVFNDGGNASGSFVFDADTNVYSGIAIATSAGSSLPGQTYDMQLPAFGGNAFFFSAINSSDLPDLTSATAFLFALQSALTNLGGTVLADVNSWNPPEGTCLNAVCDQISVPLRQLISGEVSAPITATPLPAALPLFLTGIAGLGLVARRRKQKQFAA